MFCPVLYPKFKFSALIVSRPAKSTRALQHVEQIRSIMKSLFQAELYGSEFIPLGRVAFSRSEKAGGCHLPACKDGDELLEAALSLLKPPTLQQHLEVKFETAVVHCALGNFTDKKKYAGSFQTAHTIFKQLYEQPSSPEKQLVARSTSGVIRDLSVK
jgi:hypothetical protein